MFALVAELTMRFDDHVELRKGENGGGAACAP
jgi:hypothetical protein